MFDMATRGKRAAIAAALAGAVAAGGCGGGVELEGPGFEALGLTSKKQAEQKVPDRAPLVLPPDRARLPQPQEQTAAATRENWPNDPDSLAKAEETEAARKEREYIDNGNWDPKAGIDEWNKLMDPSLRKPGIFSKNKPIGDEYRDTTEYPNR